MGTRLLRSIAVVAALAAAAHAQGDPAVSATLSSGVLKLGDAATLVVRLENAGTGSIRALPEVDGLRFGAPRGPSYEQGSSIVGGRIDRWQRLSWTITVQPFEEGRFEIPSFEVDGPAGPLATRPLALTVVRDLSGEDLGFLEVSASATTLVEGQPFELELRFGWARAIAGKVNYAHLALPWWGELPGVVELDGDEPAPNAKLVQGIGLNLDGQVTVEELEPEVRDGQAYRVFRLRRRYLPSRALALEFPQGFLEFASMRDRGGFFDRRREKVESWFVSAPAFTLDVAPLPSEGRPFDFGGAVGRLAASASVEPRDLFVGESLKLTVEWSGAGNLEFFEPPDPARLEAFDGFRSFGWTEDKTFERRTVVYDLAPLSPDVTEVPPLALPVYDPVDGRYATVETAPVPIRVRPLEDPAGLDVPASEGFARDLRDVDVRPVTGGADPRGPRDGVVVASLLLVPALWLGLRTVVRRRRGDPSAPAERRRRAARRRLARDLSRAAAPNERLASLTEFLGARSREPANAWVGRRASEWARGNGAPRLEAEAAAELDELVARLERAAYADGDDVGSDEVLAVARRCLGGGL